MKTIVCKICGKTDERVRQRGFLCKECYNKQIRMYKNANKIKCKKCGKVYDKHYFMVFGEIGDVCEYCIKYKELDKGWDINGQIRNAVVKKNVYEFMKPIMDELLENNELFRAFNLFKQRILHKQKTYSVVRDKTLENAILCKCIQKYCIEKNL